MAKFFETAHEDFYPQLDAVTVYPREPRVYLDILDRIPAMTCPTVMHMLNCAVRCMEDDEVYLEVGAWRGGTFCGALIGTDKHGIAIDDDSMVGIEKHDKDGRKNSDVWRENVAHFGLTDQATFVDGSVPQVWEHTDLTGGKRVGVYLFDGDKSTTLMARAGLVGVVPFLADQALILIDDANTLYIKQAMHLFLHEFRDYAVPVFDFSTPQNPWPCGFWNGLAAIGWGVKLEY